MKNKSTKISPVTQEKSGQIKEDPEGYPLYPDSEDIYGKYQKDRSVDPDEPESKVRPTYNLKNGKFNRKDFEDDMSGSDLDIPGLDPDDEWNHSGGEDEENNYYSLGGDEHNDLDEDYLDLQF